MHVQIVPDPQRTPTPEPVPDLTVPPESPMAHRSKLCDHIATAGLRTARIGDKMA